MAPSAMPSGSAAADRHDRRSVGHAMPRRAAAAPRHDGRIDAPRSGGRDGRRPGRRRRSGPPAARPRVQTAIAAGQRGANAAAGGRVAQVRRRARDDVERPPVRADVRERGEQLLGVRVARAPEDLADRPLLGDPARVHDQRRGRTSRR